MKRLQMNYVAEKSVLLVANKTDGIDAEAAVLDFAVGLGEVHPIAAAHGRGVSAMLETALRPILDDWQADSDEDDDGMTLLKLKSKHHIKRRR